MAEVHRNGFTDLSVCELEGAAGQQYRVNILFVHGLRGHPVRTWEDKRDIEKQDNDKEDEASSSRKSLKAKFSLKRSTSKGKETSVENDFSATKVFWPKDFLAQDIPDAQVWTYGYNADVTGGLFQANNKNSVSQHGQDLAVRIERDLDNEKPIIFVAHSLGGILVKDAMRRSKVCRERTRFITFLGTPHRGSNHASWGEIASNLARLALQDTNKKLIETLEVNNEVLDNINDQFKDIVYERKIKIHSFQEARGISGMKGLEAKVVDQFSAKLDLPREFETVESIDANHMEMARCKTKSDDNYRAIYGVLKQACKKHLAIQGEDGLVAELQQMKLENQTVNGENEAVQISNIAPSSTFYYIPFVQNRKFVGRAAEIERLDDKFFVEKDSLKIAVVGLGGVGKSQVALEFAYKVKKSRPEYSIYWMSVISVEAFEQSCKEIARKCSIGGASGKGDVKPLVQQYLNSDESGKWLLIVDNADDNKLLFGSEDRTSEGITDFLPEREDGFILFTTRYRDTAVSLAGADIIELREMDNQEAYDFLKKSIIRKDLLHDQAVVEELLEELTYLPLAIAQSIAYINMNPLMTISKYLGLLRNTEEDMISVMSREFRDNTRYKTSRNAVATTWLVSFEQMRQSNPDASEILSFISFIEPKAIPLSLLPILLPKERMEHALGALCAYSFLATQSDGFDVFNMHRLVHLATSIWLKQNGSMVEWYEDVSIYFSRLLPTCSYDSNYDFWRPCIPHISKYLQGEVQSEIINRYVVGYRYGICLGYEQKRNESIKWFLETSRWMENYHDPKEKELGGLAFESQFKLAEAYISVRETDKAIELLEPLCIIEKNTPLRLQREFLLRVQHTLIIAYGSSGRLEIAIKLMNDVVLRKKEILGVEHRVVLQSQLQLAIFYREAGDTIRAIELLEHIEKLYAKTDMESSSTRMAIMNELATNYLSIESSASEGVEILERVVEVEARTFGKESFSCLCGLINLGIAYGKVGEWRKSMQTLEYAVIAKQVTLVDHGPLLLTAQHQLAKAYLYQVSDTQLNACKAIDLFENVVAVTVEKLAIDNPNRLQSEIGLAVAYTNARINETKAVKLLEHVIAVRTKLHEDDHFVVLLNKYHLAMLHKNMGDLDKGFNILQQIATLFRKQCPPENDWLLAVEKDLENFYN